VLGLTGTARAKAFLIHVVDTNTGSIWWFNPDTNAWENTGNQITIATDAIQDVEDRTHYADFATVTELAQLRFMVHSIMNVARLDSMSQPDVVMPEMQFFSLPAMDEAINSGDVATVSYLKAEDANGNLYDILGRHQRLPHQATSNFRIHVGQISHLENAPKLYLSVTSDTDTTASDEESLSSNSTVNFTISSASTALRFYKLYVVSSDGETIILSSGYTGGQL